MRSVMIPAGLVPALFLTLQLAPAQDRPVQLRDGKLSVRAADLALAALLDEITQLTSIPFVIAREVSDSPVSVRVDELAPDLAIREVLAKFDCFLLYASETEGRARLKVVWVYPKGRGASVQPVPKEEWASTKEIEQQLSDEDPGARARAYESLIARKRTKAADDVVRCLQQERNEAVRLRVLYAAIHGGVRIPAGLLTSLVATDSSEMVRVIALDALHSHPNIRAIATSALQDPGPAVRDKALELLDYLKGAESRTDTENPER